MTRFRKAQLCELIELLGFPRYMFTENDLQFPSEYGFFIYLYHSSYPTKLQRMQKMFGREYSQLSRIENRVKDFLLIRNRHKVVNNIEWYSDRFNLYATAHNRAISISVHNNQPGTIPNIILNIVGSIDGSSFPISRLKVIFKYVIFILYLLNMPYLY